MNPAGPTNVFHPTTALITGALGQDRAYLGELALRHGCTVSGGVRGAARVVGSERAWRLRHLGIEQRLVWAELDLRDAHSIDAALRAHQPDVVFNLAAQSSVRVSFDSPLETAETNAMGALRPFEAARRAPWPVRVVQAASADILAADLDGAVRAASPYAASKAFAHLMARVYRESLGVFVSSAVLYNHESPLRGREFVTHKIVTALVKIRAGKQNQLALGNLDAQRDWSHARDIADGLWRIATAQHPGETMLGSGCAHSVREFVELAARALGMRLRWQGTVLQESALDEDTGRTVVALDAEHFRPADTSHDAADLTRARALGFEPRTSLDAMIAEMIQFEIDREQRSPP
jgi:GDPmannose 4,6-dehydratase